MPFTKKIEAKNKAGDLLGSEEVAFPATFEEAAEMWGEEETLALAIRAKIVEVQAEQRRQAETGTSGSRGSIMDAIKKARNATK